MKFCSNRENQSVSMKKVLIPLLVILIIAAIAAILTINSFTRSFSDDPDAIKEAAESVVTLYMYDANGVNFASSSGFAAFDNDIIITNHHCIQGNVYSIEAQRKDGSTFPIDSVIAYDEEKDIAVLRAPNCGLTPLKTANGLDSKQGQKVAAIGSPKGISDMYSTGVLSKIEASEGYSVLIATASISPGSSGGALFNDRGQVIGITSAGHLDANEIYISVPIEYAQTLYDSRTPEGEMTVTAWYEQSEHPYTVDYIMAYGSMLHNQTITTSGYISGMDTDIYLVSSPELVAFSDTRSTFDLAATMKLRELRSNGFALQVDITRNHISTGDLNPGDSITVEGTIMYYSASDIRLVADNIVKSK